MTAFTTLPDGTRLRYHAGPPYITECADPRCGREHATLAQLADFGSPVADCRRALEGEGGGA